MNERDGVLLPEGPYSDNNLTITNASVWIYKIKTLINLYCCASECDTVKSGVQSVSFTSVNEMPNSNPFLKVVLLLMTSVYIS
jgi:hypothetical protein